MKLTKAIYDSKIGSSFSLIEKVVLSISIGKCDKNERTQAKAILEAISGQISIYTFSKKSVAEFKIRKGMVNGVKTTLRRKMAESFIKKLIEVALPRSFTFRGFKTTQMNGARCFNFGLSDLTIFPEISEINKRINGMNISIVFKEGVNNKEKALKILEDGFYFPFILS